MELRSEIKSQIDKYRKLLQQAESIEKEEQFNKAYKRHISKLNEIENAYFLTDFDSLVKLIKAEARNYGWSFLPHEHGERVETAFWHLKKMVLPEE